MTDHTWSKTAAALLMKHSDSLYGYILACLRDRTDADDVLQNVAMAVIESEDGPTENDRFLAWAREIARRRVVEFFRLRKRDVELNSRLADRLARAAQQVEEESDAIAHRAAMLKCLEMMSGENQQILIQRYARGHGRIAELAAESGRTEQALHALLYRLRQKLRECITRRVALEATE